jgi:outer membrane protein OmpA-like peptidoglycan-associated protein
MKAIRFSFIGLALLFVCSTAQAQFGKRLGKAATNQTLSDARSKAVVDKLVEMGVAKDHLQSVGKGQTSPIADNSTDEGRAKNRRVEFVKIN